MSKESLTVRECANVLGLSHRTVRKMIHAGRLPAIRVGVGSTKNHLRVTKIDLIEFRLRNPAYRRKDTTT